MLLIENVRFETPMCPLMLTELVHSCKPPLSATLRLRVIITLVEGRSPAISALGGRTTLFSELFRDA